MDIQQSGYTWYIHGRDSDIPHISTKYICGIFMDIHGISFDVLVCTWYIHVISMDIPRFLNLDFSAGPCCCSLSMLIRLWVLKSVYSTARCFFLTTSGALPFAAPPATVWVIKSVLFHAPPWQLCQGKRRPTKGCSLPPFLLRRRR
jgi:hypothetical protein